MDFIVPLRMITRGAAYPDKKRPDLGAQILVRGISETKF
jgi:hypothetical protein